MKRDELEHEVVKALSLAGASVTLLTVPGAPRLLVGFECRTYLAEVKGKPTDKQRVWRDAWEGGEVFIVGGADDALRMIGVRA